MGGKLESVPEVTLTENRSSKRGNKAYQVYERLATMVARFETSLDSEKEVGARLLNCNGPESPFHIDRIDYEGTELIVFEGVSGDGSRVKLVQHYTLVNLILIAMPRLHIPARRIGFDLGRDLADRLLTTETGIVGTRA